VEEKKNRLLTVRQFSAEHPWPSESALRALIFDAPHNGFSPAFKRIGRRVLIDVSAFWGIVDTLNNQSRGAS